MVRASISTRRRRCQLIGRDLGPAASVASPAGETTAVFDGRSGQTVLVPRYRREQLMPGARFPGPAIVAEDETATFITASFDAWIDGIGSIVMDRKEQTT